MLVTEDEELSYLGTCILHHDKPEGIRSASLVMSVELNKYAVLQEQK
jgi:hypothetical protein